MSDRTLEGGPFAELQMSGICFEGDAEAVLSNRVYFLQGWQR